MDPAPSTEKEVDRPRRSISHIYRCSNGVGRAFKVLRGCRGGAVRRQEQGAVIRRESEPDDNKNKNTYNN